MILLVFCSLIAVVGKAFKKTAPDGKITLYLPKRDYTTRPKETDPIDGIVVIDEDYLKGKAVSAWCMLTTTYRYGRESDEVMGVRFSRELTLAKTQLFPVTTDTVKTVAPLQEKLMEKFPKTSFPFSFEFPINAPNSVTLETGESTNEKPLGVFYSIKCLIKNEEDDKGKSLKKIVFSLGINKLQHSSLARDSRRFPTSLVAKEFIFSNGYVNLEVSLPREIYYHGDIIDVSVAVVNTSSKCVKAIKCYLVQHCELTMIGTRYFKYVGSLESTEGCPLLRGGSLSKKLYLVPSTNQNKFGIALDSSYLKSENVTLASSTLYQENENPSDALGIVVSYSVRVKLDLGTLGGQLVVDVPFKLVRQQE